jgi:hypothetical protein
LCSGVTFDSAVRTVTASLSICIGLESTTGEEVRAPDQT